MGWQDRAYNREDGGYTMGPRLSDYKPTGLALALIVVLLGIFVLQIFGVGRLMMDWGALTFVGGAGWWQPWRFVTYQYLHADGGHIFWNMLSIYFIVPIMERTWGWRRTLAFYTVGGIVAGFVYALMSYAFGFRVGTLVGASGSILAVLGAIAATMPGLTFFGFIPVRILALLFAILYILTIAHDRNMSNAAHLGGLVFGYVAPLIGMNRIRNLTERIEKNRQRRVVRAEIDEQAAIDRILSKVHEQGMNSLSRGERNTLKRATDRQRQTDAKRARRANH